MKEKDLAIKKDKPGLSCHQPDIEGEKSLPLPFGLPASVLVCDSTVQPAAILKIL
jgi:hypothetical protein